MPRTASLIVGEKERAILTDRPPQRGAKLIALILRFGLIGGREEIAGVHRAVAEKLVGASVHRVGARFHHHVHLAAGIASETGVVNACEYFEFLDSVHRRCNAERVEFRIAVVHTVEQEVVGILARAIDIERDIAARRTCRTGRSGRRAGHKQSQLVEVPAIERKAGNIAIFDHRAERCRIGLEHAPRGCDHDGISTASRE